MSNIKIDVDAFFRRTAKVYRAWKNDPDWQALNADALLVALGADDDVVYARSLSFQLWLVGYELSDTLILFCENAIYFLASKKKIDFVRQLENAATSHAAATELPTIKFLVRDKSDNDKNNFQKITDCIKDSKDGKVLGVIQKDLQYKGSFMDSWRKHWDKQSSIKAVDINANLTLIMSPKTDSELNHIKKASQITSEVFSKYLKEQIMDIIDNEKSVKHIKLADDVEKAIKKHSATQNIDSADLDTCYPPILQSGGNYKLKFSVRTSEKDPVHFGAIICSFGARYKYYCSNIVRTMLVNPSEKIQNTYDFLVSLEDLILSQLTDGVNLGDVYSSVMKKVRKERPDLEDKLTKNFGFSMGIDFRDNSIAITANSNVVAKKGMVFNVNLGLSGLINKDAQDDKGKNIALFIGDTVMVNEGAPATNLTTSKKKIKNIAIFLKDAESDDEEKENKGALPDPESFGRGKRSAVLDQKLRQDASAEEKRKHHQKELMQKVNEEALRRIKDGVTSEKVTKVRKAPVSYKSPGQLPRENEVRQLKIYVDKKYETIILPIFGVPVPFHIATVKNISNSVEGDYTYLRINFFHPGAAIGKDGGGFSQPDATFLKELTYRSTNVREPGEISAPSSNLNTAFRLIKDIQKKYKTREAEEKEKADLVTQDTLITSSGKGYPKLKDLYIRPNIVQKRLSGILEAHINGFRYTSIRGDKIDILYNNIKHAFFQPCDGEMIILLHFHLKNPILFGKKKQQDVQFYTEVGEITTDLGKHQHMHDRDDLAAEQAERELRHKLKQAFKGFTDKVTSVTKDELEFETPFRDLGFHGVPFRETVLLQPTSGCLVSLTSWPPFVVTLDDIQLVHFERVQFHLKNFDMVFIFKDYTKKVMMVTTVPMQMLDHVKEWLNQSDIKYTEGIQSLNWPKIMKTIVDDPEGFFEDGGWSFLDPESEGEEDDDDDEDDDEFEISGSDEEFNEDESEDDYSSEVSEESFSEEGLDSDESSGKDWSDLEREAAEDDEEEEDDRSRKHRSSKHRSPKKSMSHSDKRKRESSGSSRHHRSSKKSRR